MSAANRPAPTGAVRDRFSATTTQGRQIVLEGKLALVAGVANRRSIAWALAQELHARGAKLAFTYQGERIKKSVTELAASIGSDIVVECDVRSDEDLDRAFGEIVDRLGGAGLGGASGGLAAG